MFLVCGEALMDVFALGDTPSGMALDARVGGSPFNVAVGLARLAQPVAFVGSISLDVLGERLLRALQDEGVITDTVVRVDAPTTTGLVGLDSRGVPVYSFHGQGGADRQLGPAVLATLPAQPSALHVGSFTTVVEPIASTLRGLVDALRPTTVVSYDPNVRLGVEPDLERWRSTLRWMLPRTHLLKVSEEDLGLLMPQVGVESFCASALGAGVGLVVVTRGAAGASARTASATVATAAVEVATIDTVGAGDTFQAALLAWLAEHGRLEAAALASLDAGSLDAALRFASRAAAITCSRRGADLPKRGELG